MGISKHIVDIQCGNDEMLASDGLSITAPLAGGQRAECCRWEKPGAAGRAADGVMRAGSKVASQSEEVDSDTARQAQKQYVGDTALVELDTPEAHNPPRHDPVI